MMKKAGNFLAQGCLLSNLPTGNCETFGASVAKEGLGASEPAEPEPHGGNQGEIIENLNGCSPKQPVLADSALSKGSWTGVVSRDTFQPQLFCFVS